MCLKNIVFILSSCFFLLLSNGVYAQHKYEREYTIKAEKVPESAKAFIDSIGVDSKLKWYREIGLNTVTLEAKFKHNRKKYSVEFDTLGILQDVEFVIASNEIPPSLLYIIAQKLDSLYEKWKFRKIQTHYSGGRGDIISSIHGDKPAAAVKVFYEIVLKGRNLGNTQEYEITFNAKGEMERIEMIKQDGADNLEY